VFVSVRADPEGPEDEPQHRVMGGATRPLLELLGVPTRELFAARDLPGNFYMQGSMGHAPAIALGIALERPKRIVFVLDGDGAVLMHMGTLSTIGGCAPPNLVHVTVDNEAYESTGGQRWADGTNRPQG